MISSKNWGLEIDPDVFKVLKKIPRRRAEVILEVIKLLPINPYFGDIRKMKDSKNVGQYSVIFTYQHL